MSGFAERIVGLRLGAYDVRRLIARGGMGIVYEGYQSSLDRVVAIKVLYPHLSDDPTFVERFQREARAVARLNHPHIVRMIDYGSDEGYHYMVMDYVAGGSLRQLLIDNRGRLPLNSSMLTLAQIGSALSWAHRRGYVHRDVKPGNILLDEEGAAHLSDFGLVKLVDTALTMTGVMVGTPEYMAPEQTDISRPVGPAADQYALAIVAYELLVGQVPFKAPTPAGLIQKHVYEPPPPPRSFDPSLSPDVDAVLLRALAKDPEQRFPTVDDFVRELVAAVGAGPFGIAEALPPDSPGTGLTPTPIWTQADATDVADPSPASAAALERSLPRSAADDSPTTDATISSPTPLLASAPPVGSLGPTAGPSSRRSRWPLVAIGGLLVVLLGGAAAGFAVYSGNGDDPAPTATALQGIAPTATEAALVAATSTVETAPTATVEPSPTAAPTDTAAPPTATEVAIVPTATVVSEATATQVVVIRPIAPTPTTARITVGDSDTSIVVQADFDSGDAYGFFTGTNDYGNSGAVAEGQYTISVVEQGWQSMGQTLTSSLGDGIIVTDAQVQGDGKVGVSARFQTLADGSFVLYACWLDVAGQAGCSFYSANAWADVFRVDLPGFSATDPHQYQMAMVGDTLVFVIDDTDVGSATVAAGGPAAGYWGFFAESLSGSVQASFDSFVIAKVNQ